MCYGNILGVYGQTCWCASFVCCRKSRATFVQYVEFLFSSPDTSHRRRSPTEELLPKILVTLLLFYYMITVPIIIGMIIAIAIVLIVNIVGELQR